MLNKRDLYQTLKCFFLKNEIYSYRHTIEISLEDINISLYSNVNEVHEEVHHRLGYYFKVKNNISSKNNPNAIVKSSLISYKGQLGKINNVFTNFGEKIVIHGGNNPEENRKGFKLSYGQELFINIQDTSSLIYVNKEKKEINILNFNSENLAKDTRRLIKDNLISRYLEKNNWVIFHGGFVSYQGKGILFTGKSGAGKTTALMNLCSDGAHFVSNDRVFIRQRSDKGYEVMGWPENINIGLGAAFENSNLRPHIPKKFSTINDKNVWNLSQKWSLSLKKFNEIFQNQIQSYCTDLSLIIVPNVSPVTLQNCLIKIDKPQLESLLLKNCLTPTDSEHPHWAEYIFLNEKDTKESAMKLIKSLSHSSNAYQYNFKNNSNDLIKSKINDD